MSRPKFDLGIWSFASTPTYNYRPITPEREQDLQNIQSVLKNLAQRLTEYLANNEPLFLRLFSNLPPHIERVVLHNKLLLVSCRNDLFTDQMFLTIYLSELVEVSFYFNTPQVFILNPILKPYCAEGSVEEINLLCDLIIAEIS